VGDVQHNGSKGIVLETPADADSSSAGSTSTVVVGKSREKSGSVENVDSGSSTTLKYSRGSNQSGGKSKSRSH
jgi:hypothetical protein